MKIGVLNTLLIVDNKFNESNVLKQYRRYRLIISFRNVKNSFLSLLQTPSLFYGTGSSLFVFTFLCRLLLLGVSTHRLRPSLHIYYDSPSFNFSVLKETCCYVVLLRFSILDMYPLNMTSQTILRYSFDSNTNPL